LNMNLVTYCMVVRTLLIAMQIWNEDLFFKSKVVIVVA
jgi:hypothetical protein